MNIREDPNPDVPRRAAVSACGRSAGICVEPLGDAAPLVFRILEEEPQRQPLQDAAVGRVEHLAMTVACLTSFISKFSLSMQPSLTVSARE